MEKRNKKLNQSKNQIRKDRKSPLVVYQDENEIICDLEVYYMINGNEEELKKNFVYVGTESVINEEVVKINFK